MAKQISVNPETKRISELYSLATSNPPKLIIQPEWQRKFIWSINHQEKFIETILLGYPFPEIYIAQTGIDVETIAAQDVVVDGQQRISTIIKYIDEKTELGKSIKKYTDLTEKEKEDFLNYRVTIRNLGDLQSEMIKEIFRRINLTQYSVNQMEIQNAVYDGEFITTAKELLEIIDTRNLPTFSDYEITRMGDLYFILLLLSTIEHGGYFNSVKEINRYVEHFNDTYSHVEDVKTKFIEVIDKFSLLKLPPDSIWYRKSNFFTLFIELYNLKKDIPTELKQRLIEFENNVISNKTKNKEQNEFALYYSYMYAGTNSRQARVIRGDILKKYVLS